MVRLPGTKPSQYQELFPSNWTLAVDRYEGLSEEFFLDDVAAESAEGVADLVDGVNDEESAVALIDELFRLAGIYQTCIVCVLHLSPSGYKLRGHLGSEISRKASGILSVEKESGSKYSIVKALKVREGSPLEVPMLLIGWDDERRYHTFQGHKDDNGGTSREERKITELRSVATPLFERESKYVWELSFMNTRLGKSPKNLLVELLGKSANYKRNRICRFNLIRTSPFS